MRVEESQVRPATATRRRETARDRRSILGEIRDYCRATQTAESTFGRLVVNDGKLVSRLRDGARITTGTLDKVRAYLSERAHRFAVGAQASRRWPSSRQRRRAADAVARRLPILRQPPEIPAVRLDLQREDRGRAPHLARARQSAADAAGAAHLRCRRRRRHRAVAGDAGGACALSRPCRSTSWPRRSATKTSG